MTNNHLQSSINLSSAALAGGSSNIVQVQWNSFSNAGGTYYVALNNPIDLYGNAAADWEIVPGTPGVSSDTVRSANRTASFWIAQGCFQCGPEASVRRAFLSAFNPGPIGPLGVTGCASGFEGNNDRAETTVFYGGLTPDTNGLFFSIAWNGVTPLTLNSGQLVLFVI